MTAPHTGSQEFTQEYTRREFQDVMNAHLAQGIISALRDLKRRLLFRIPRNFYFEETLSYRVESVVEHYNEDRNEFYRMPITMWLPTVADCFKMLGHQCFRRHRPTIIITNIRSGKQIILNRDPGVNHPLYDNSDPGPMRA